MSKGNRCLRCRRRFKAGDPHGGGLCKRCWETDPLDYEAGFAAGIEAAAQFVETDQNFSFTPRLVRAIRNLKPEASDG